MRSMPKSAASTRGKGGQQLRSGRTCAHHAKCQPSTAAGQHPRAGSPQSAAPSQRRQAVSGVAEVRAPDAPAGLHPRAESPQAATPSQGRQEAQRSGGRHLRAAKKGEGEGGEREGGKGRGNEGVTRAKGRACALTQRPRECMRRRPRWEAAAEGGGLRRARRRVWFYKGPPPSASPDGQACRYW